MAQHASAEKRNRQTIKITAINRARTSRIRGLIKQVEAAIEEGNQKAAAEALKLAQPEIMRGVSKGVLKHETASRKVSRLAARVKSLSKAA